jgi:hypothetical protein
MMDGKSVSCGCTFDRDIDLTGRRFGRLLVMGRADTFKKGKHAWRCLCDCGNETVTLTNYLRSGQTISCGCRKAQAAGERCLTHGDAKRGNLTAEYAAWSNMKTRCENPAFNGYAEYGGRGIAVHAGWRESFEEFLASVGRRPSREHSLDRFPDTNGNYEPGNVRWATRKQQANNKQCQRHFTFQGLCLTAAEWVERLGVKYSAFHMRIERGWSIERAVTQPYRPARLGKAG